MIPVHSHLLDIVSLTSIDKIQITSLIKKNVRDKIGKPVLFSRLNRRFLLRGNDMEKIKYTCVAHVE